MSRFNSFIYALGRAACRVIARLNGARLLGAEHIPSQETLLVVCNHTSLGDPPLLTAFFPRRLVYLAKDEFRRQPLTRLLFSAVGTVFVRRGQGDLAALRAAVKQLKAGSSVAIFPEGTRHYDQQLGEFHHGAAFIASQAQVRVLPVAVLNSRHFLNPFKRDMLLLVGPPLDVPAARADRAALEQLTGDCRQSIEALLLQGRQQLQAEGLLPADSRQNDA